jgi:hypothetical protein
MQDRDLSDEELIELVLTFDVNPESRRRIERIRDDRGSQACLRRMLSLFSQRRSAELCTQAWEIALMVCLTEEKPEMDYATGRLWTQAFLEALNDERPDIRECVVGSLDFGLDEEGFTAEVMEALFTRLQDISQDVRFGCTRLLARAGVAALPYAFAALTIHGSQTGQSSVGSHESGIWESLSVIDGVLSRPEVGLDDRAACVEAVAGFLRERSVCDGVDSMAIWKAGDTLGEHIGDAAALSQLLSLLEHPDPRVRASVAHGLSHIDDSRARQGLQLLSRDPNESVSNEALRYLNPKESHE